MIMFYEIYNPFHMVQQPEDDMMKNMTFEERLRFCILQAISFFCMLVIALVACAVISLFTGCTTPKIVENHHHHYEQSDTLAIQAMVDKQLTSWHEQMDSSWTQRWQQYVSEQSTQEHERERITETVTTFVDSLGREVRQEQRTTERDMTRQQQQREERLVQEWESRLQRALDERDSVWQEKLEAVKVHQEQKDSTSSVVTPAQEDNRPWYRRWWDNMQWLALGGAVVLLLLLTRGMWQKVLKK